MPTPTAPAQPRCPSCSGDLRSAIAANKRVCPHCGAAFTMDDLRHARREQSAWSEAGGLRVAIVSVLWRAIVVFAVVGGVLWLAAPALVHIPHHWAWMGLIGLVMTIPGWLVGVFLTHNLADRAGFVGPVLAAIPIVAVWVAALVAANLVKSWRGLPDYPILLMAGAIALWATLWCVKETMIDS